MLVIKVVGKGFSTEVIYFIDQKSHLRCAKKNEDFWLDGSLSSSEQWDEDF